MKAFLDGGVADYQMAAFLMAVYFVGMTEPETEALTRAMLESGEVLDTGGILGPKVDKHSTGGVGDKLSLVVAPIAAAAGVRVPMVSGRGLGHTGGTLDKLESIPGMRTDLSPEAMLRIVADVGMSVVGQSPRMAPADLRMYALRDVTATVECIPLIVASILSKKLAAGLDGLVLDVKVGRGAFMGDLGRARELSLALCSTARGLGLPAVAVLTDMESPLGLAVGNSLEVEESVAVLRGGGPDDVRDVSLELASRMIALGGLARGPADAASRARAVLESGQAYDVFLRFVEAQGGDTRFVDGQGEARAGVDRQGGPGVRHGVRERDRRARGGARVRAARRRQAVRRPEDRPRGRRRGRGARGHPSGRRAASCVRSRQRRVGCGRRGEESAGGLPSDRGAPPRVRGRIIEVLEPGE